MYRYKNVSWVLWIDQFFFFSKGKIIQFFFSLYISNLIYRCDKWSKYWWMLYLFHLNLWKWKLSFLCMQTQFIGSILTYEKWAMGAFLLWNFNIIVQFCVILYMPIDFFSCYCILGDFNLQYCIYTHIYFCSLSCNRTNCLHILLKKNDLSSTKWNFFSPYCV